MRRGVRFAAMGCAVVLAACGGGSEGDSAGPSESAQHRSSSNASGHGSSLKLSVLSSDPQWVSGNDARIHVRAAPGQRDKLELLLNGRTVDVDLKEVSDGLEGVVRGLALGKNRLEVKQRRGNNRDTLVLTNWPIEGPMFTGPQQMPFVCTTIQGAVGRQPLVDSATAPGYKVSDASGNVIGYSRNCSIDTFVSYLLPQQRQRRAEGRCPPMAAGRPT